MDYNHAIEEFIRARRKGVRADMDEFRKLLSLKDAIRHAALCHFLPNKKRHPHQRRIPSAALREAEIALQRAVSRLSVCKNFEELHDQIASTISPIRSIGDLTIYDIAHRIGAYLRKSPRLIYLHCGTAVGARHLGFTGATLAKTSLPAVFSKLSSAEIEDFLCIYKDVLAGSEPRSLQRKRCVPHRTTCGPIYGSDAATNRKFC